MKAVAATALLLALCLSADAARTLKADGCDAYWSDWEVYALPK